VPKLINTDRGLTELLEK